MEKPKHVILEMFWLSVLTFVDNFWGLWDFFAELLPKLIEILYFLACMFSLCFYVYLCHIILFLSYVIKRWKNAMYQ